MLKTISAALLAVSVFAAPAFAGGYGKTTQAPNHQGRARELEECSTPTAGWAAIIISTIAIIIVTISTSGTTIITSTETCACSHRPQRTSRSSA